MGNTKCVRKCAATATFLHCWGVKQPLWIKDWQFLIILNVNLPHDAAITPGYLLKGNENMSIHRLVLE